MKEEVALAGSQRLASSHLRQIQPIREAKVAGDLTSRNDNKPFFLQLSSGEDKT
jgi:hypothetical protein